MVMISLPPDLSHLVEQKLSSGAYQSEEEVLHAALNALTQQEEAAIASIKRGMDDFANGRSRPAEEADAEFRQRHGLGSAQ
jgi:putative addiction module CopG family antidote